MTSSEYTPDPAGRPDQVVWAHRCWTAAGALLVVLGLIELVAAFFVKSAPLSLAGLGVLMAAVGVAYVLIGSKAYLGDVRWRSSLAALTLVVVAMLLILALGFQSPYLAVALLVALIGLFGSLLAYRPESEKWFTGVEPQPKKGKAGKRKNQT
ncbi:hypothetical protein [Gordonia soli]|uniref:Uncharacterized protein n=1 Tax=Gordonia soli NBRC 108243 TaxID=1223545 RepID=M0QHH4_9ACTN|nr:hypothetical protein [Gordonia soli]GAC68003.1 hypothetical protein GS4_11_02740 [Gordonia soli NBRC 108243]